MSDPSALAVLYAEDDPDDRLLADMACHDCGAANPVVFVENGIEALEYLRHTGRHSRQAGWLQPGLVLLDLNMPGMGGIETTRIVRADPSLRHMPVVMLTTSAAPEDIAASYDAGASSYIIKPKAFATLVHIFERLCGYWFDVNTLAPHDP